MNNYGEDNGKLSISAFGPLSNRIAAELSAKDAEIERLKGELFEFQPIQQSGVTSPARSALAQKVLQTVEDIGMLHATDAEVELLESISAALQDLFKKEGIEIKESTHL